MQVAFRTMTKIRGSLVTIIFDKMLLVRAENNNAAAAVSLMSTDVDRITMTTFMCIHLFPDIVQLAIGLYILSTQLGATAVAPVILCAICIGVAVKIGKMVPPRQRRWMAAIQKRVGITSDVISAMKGIKVAGLSERVDEQVQGLRKYELDRSVQFRKMQITTQLLGEQILTNGIVGGANVSRRNFTNTLDASSHIYCLCYLTKTLWWSGVQCGASIHCPQFAQRLGRPSHGPDAGLDQSLFGPRMS